MKLPTAVQIGVLIGAVALAVGWIKGCRDLRALEDSASARVQALEDSIAGLNQRDSVRLVAIDSLKAVESTALDSVVIFRPGRERIDTVLQMVPETTRVLVREVVEDLQSTVSQCLVAVGACQARADSLDRGLKETRSLLLLAKAQQDSTLLEIRQLTPSFSLKPSFGVGAFAGVCTDGRPCLGIGGTVQWRFP